MYLSEVGGGAIEYLRSRSKSRVYLTDPEAWLSDVLDRKWWSKQSEIGASVAANRFTAVKSCNGVGKSQLGGDLVTWFAAVNDPRETTVMISMPVAKQITTVAFRYINENLRLMKQRDFSYPGRTTQEPSWKVDELDGKEIVQAKRPADANLISSFQGIHDKRVMVLLDEAGGLPEDMWIGANAVTTNEYVRILAIGNPDALNTGFHRRFTDRERFSDWNLMTISAYDSPNFTGEVVYPDDPQRDLDLRSKLVQRDWAEMMEKQAHPNVVLAKVHGEFPKDGDTSFFPQSSITKSYALELSPTPEDKRWLGIDLAFSGSDKTTVYLNHGGKIRKLTEWVHEDDFMKVARMIHQIALSNGVDEVRVDAAGTGRGVYSNLKNEPEFTNRDYELVGIQGGHSSPDTQQWAQARAWHYDCFRTAMQQGLIDLDDCDLDLRDEMNAQTYGINNRGAIQITTKTDMRKAGIHSPDHLDAVIYSAVDVAWVKKSAQKGDRVSLNPSNISMEGWQDGPGEPW